MAVTLNQQINCQLDTEAYLTGVISDNSNSGHKISALMAPGTAVAVPGFLGFAYTSIDGIWFTVDQAATLLFTTSGSPITVDLTAGGVFNWSRSSGQANPFGTSTILGLEITNTVAVNVTGRYITG